MTNVLQVPSQMPSILAMVQRVKRECGLPVPTTLVGTTDQTALVVLEALNDATVDIYMRARWEWKQCLYGLPLVAGTTQYALPADFERMCIDPKSAGYPISGLSQEEWQQQIPAVSITSGQPQYFTTHRCYEFRLSFVNQGDFLPIVMAWVHRGVRQGLLMLQPSKQDLQVRAEGQGCHHFLVRCSLSQIPLVPRQRL